MTNKITLKKITLPAFFNQGSMDITIVSNFDLYDKPVHILYLGEKFNNPYFISNEVTNAMGYADLTKPIRILLKSATGVGVYRFPLINDNGYENKIVRYLDRSALYLLALKVKSKDKSLYFLEELYNSIYPRLDIIYGAYEFGSRFNLSSANCSINNEESK